MSGYNPDQSELHQMYVFTAQQKSPHDEECFDDLHGQMHSKEQVESLIKILKNLGFAVQLRRVSTVTLENDPLPGEMEEA